VEKMDLQIQKTNMALTNTFFELLEEKRFEDITVNELCDRAMYAGRHFINILVTNMSSSHFSSEKYRRSSTWKLQAAWIPACL
jgi:hypothetical protein